MTLCVAWNIEEVLSRELGERIGAVKCVLHMIEKEECTIPFIARYRREKTGGMDAEKLRKLQDKLDELRAVQKKIATHLKTLKKQKNYDKQIERALCSAESLVELEHIAAPLKGEKKTSLANKARSLGLQEAANELLQKKSQTNLTKWIKNGTEGRQTLAEVTEGVKNILADGISKERQTFEFIRDKFTDNKMFIITKLTASAKNILEHKTTKNKAKTSQSDVMKFKNYFDFNLKVSYIKSYQTLAINRAESLKFVSVSLQPREFVEIEFIKWCCRHWGVNYHATGHPKIRCNEDIIINAIHESYKRLIRPFIFRKVRKELTKKAHEDSMNVFGRNLKKLLLTSPVRGKIVLGVDPGFKNGCKCAVVSACGNKILETTVINLRDSKNCLEKFYKLYKSCKYNIIAIGNGTACRETEQLVSKFLCSNSNLNLQYCIVNEAGASIYSVTEAAVKEMPDLDPNLRSAVSIARRLQDPLVELVKVDPKNIGVGMYQHDVSEKELAHVLETVVQECVTFVGLDLNVASEHMLKRVAGIKPAQAKNIINWREQNGSFVCRDQLKSIKGIGDKTFQQCIGFLRVNNGAKYESEIFVTECSTGSANKKRKIVSQGKTSAKKLKTAFVENIFDQTHIHPESYEVALKLVKAIGMKKSDLGSKELNNKISKLSDENVQKLCSELNIDENTFKLIIEGFLQIGANKDIRDSSVKVLYRKNISSLKDLTIGCEMDGRVSNVTDFGVFIDIGVGRDGLCPVGKTKNWEKLRHEIGPNDVVKVRVFNVDMSSERITLEIVDTNLNMVVLK